MKKIAPPCGCSSLSITLPETNISPENRHLEKEFPMGNHQFACKRPNGMRGSLRDLLDISHFKGLFYSFRLVSGSVSS